MTGRVWWLGAWFAGLLILIVAPARALDAPELLDAAWQYRYRLADAAQESDLPPEETLRSQIAAAFKADRPRDALDPARGLAGLRPDDSAVWRDLAGVWAMVEPENPATLWSALIAYRTAVNGEEREAALHLAAPLLEARGEWSAAISAYQELAGMLPEDKDLAQKLDFLLRQYGFQIERIEARFEQERPQLCLYFTSALSDPRLVTYGDYVRISPEVPVEALASDDALCLEGVRHGETYEVTALAGLPAQDGRSLMETDSFDLTVPDRTPTVGFRAGTYVLPRMGEGTAPLTTVNVDEVALRLLRINDRNLIDQVVQDRIAGANLGGYELDEIAETHGEAVWEGSMPVENQPNRTVVTGVPVDELLPETDPGIYILAARNADEDDEWRYSLAGVQWLVVTDIGLSSFSGQHGLTVGVRSLATAEAMEGARVTLLARNNSVLGEGRTDSEGIITFAAGLTRGEGGNRPAAILAYGPEGDFTFLELTGPAFDLSDRGVSGRQEPGPLDAYLYTERGVYRPGEIVHLTALLRDDRAAGEVGLPLSLRLIRPDGVEADDVTVSDQGAGGYAHDIPLPPNARTGIWTVEARMAEDGPVIGTAYFQVEDFVPLRMRLDLTTEADALRPGETVTITADAQFLYGAPAADLPGEADLAVRAALSPFPDWENYAFGLTQEDLQPQRVSLPMEATNVEGQASLPILLDSLPDTSLPLEAEIRVSLFDIGGRPVNQTLTLPVRGRGPWIGIEGPAGGRVAQDTPADFSLIALDGEGERIALPGANWELVREIYDYQWFSTGGAWDYRVVVRDRPVASGAIDIAAADPAEILESVDWGRYRLDVFDSETGAASSVRFSAGWWTAPSLADTPDQMTVALDRSTYRAGDTAQIRLTAPFAGRALVTVANSGILETYDIALPEGGATLEVPVDEDWGVGAYILATAFRPMAEAEEEGERGPVRAVGVAWFDIDQSDRMLAVEIDAPAEIRPRQTVDIPIAVSGLAEGDEAYLTLAAVDEGILLLTDFASPDPVEHYFGQRALGVDMRDLYGNLIVSEGRRGNVRSGGDGDQMAGPRVAITKTVALYSGIVEVGPDGEATVPLDIPDYNGELRLMAVAWSAGAVGGAERSMIVRDPVVAEVALPRFLAPGDRAIATLSLHNVAGPAGSYRAELSAGGAVTVDGEAAFDGPLATDARATLPVTLVGGEPGTGEIRLSLSGPDGFAVERQWEIAVRPAQPIMSNRLTGVLEPGETFIIDNGLADLYLPGTLELAASFSSRPNLDVPGLIKALDDYPYACLEQTTSRALPLLYADELAAAAGGGFRPDDADRKVQQAINRVLALQRADGPFAVWSPFGEPDDWLTAYAMDFLIRARSEGFDVPKAALRRGLSYMQDYVSRWYSREQCQPAAAYALDVLARAGVAEISDLRYYADTCLEAFRTPIAKAQLGAALAAYGEMDRADRAFRAAAEDTRPGPDSLTVRDYGSELRDRAAVTTLMAEAGRPIDAVLAQGERTADLLGQTRWTSTQENAWAAMAAASLAGGGPLELTVNGHPAEGADGGLTLDPTAEELAQGIAVTNDGAEAVRRTVSLRGIPEDPPQWVENGFTLNRVYYTIEGIPLRGQKGPSVRQNDLVLVMITGRALTTLDHQILVVDLLPAGLEIENPSIGDGRGLGDFAETLDLTQPLHVEIRDDRYVAALDLSAGGREFRLAYLARAVTPGDFALPASFVEDMYKPEYNASTALRRLTVIPAD
ncbi:alpha-2-macroglobulin [Inquilinus sp. CAU 1745]|uniref:alpha-2-macroglobulin family protein n=1 Tax=Inquilinus sp. CAU 1745 TaxID=3140369 RepID=UPI00325B2DDB